MKKYEVELTHDQLVRVRIGLINVAKEWEEEGQTETAQKFRDALKPFAFPTDTDKDE